MSIFLKFKFKRFNYDYNNAILNNLFVKSHRSYALAAKDHYDLLVIGGGSGGLACSKEAADLGAKTALLDYVSPSPQGTTWGLGGTCVNVGCIPKKLMHNAAVLGSSINDTRENGWPVQSGEHDWSKLTDAVQSHVRSLNWGFRVQLNSKKVTYLNALGYLIDKNTVKCTSKNGDQKILTADKIVLATGMRPRLPDIAGAAEHAISSDDLFWMKKSPGKTLVIGASYVALECAGFLSGLGLDTTVMMRSIPLRGFDQQMADLVVDSLKVDGTRFLSPYVPAAIRKHQTTGQLVVSYHSTSSGPGHTTTTLEEETYDTVLMAIGRDPLTSNIGLEGVDVKLDRAGYVVGTDGTEQTSVENIFALGDILKDGNELTPVAIHAGRLLARRLYGNSTQLMDYLDVATTVFTPTEYSCIGLSEEDATSRYGADAIEVYHAYFTPLEYVISKRDSSHCYVKIITDRTADEKVLGIHYTGPNAGEIIQGFAVAFKCGLTKRQLDSTIGIHPTIAESFIGLHITKRSGLDAKLTGC